MSFLNPFWLLALPLVLLPIVIHLWNQRRHKTIEWGAMQFLLSARRMSRGLARIRHWLIMASRMLLIAGLIFVLGRPLSSGWLGSLTGGSPETILVLLDRSASMQQQVVATGQTKLSTGVAKLIETLETVGGHPQIYLIDGFMHNDALEPNALVATNESGAGEGEATRKINLGNAIPITSPRDLLDLPEASATESETNIVDLVQSALDFVTRNQTGRTDIWICSDHAENDWHPESSRWNALSGGFAKLEGVRFHLLSFLERPQENFSITVDRWERTGSRENSELVVDLQVSRIGEGAATNNEIPVTFNVNGVRTVVKLALENDSATLIGHRIPVDAEVRSGWVSVEIPIDACPADNSFYFAYSDPPKRLTVLVAEDKSTLNSMEIAAAVPSLSGPEFEAKSITPERISEIDWQETGLLIWHAPLPTDATALQLQRFLESGRSILFLPPRDSTDTEFLGASWGHWENSKGSGEAVEYWNNDNDLWGRTRGGLPLAIDDLVVYRHCKLTGGGRELARLESGAPLLTRIAGNGGAAYFLTTWPAGTHSSIDREGITLYVMVHRALANGIESLGAARQFNAGALAATQVIDLPLINRAKAGDDEDSALTAIRKLKPFRSGIYGDTEQKIAINRPVSEDQSPAVSDETLKSMLAGMEYQVIKAEVGNERPLASEIWRAFIVFMAIALIVEAALCLPERVSKKSDAVSTQTANARAAA
ncbi:MAG: BatA domain-containing protein [Pirellulaceae bacterium]